MGNKLFYTFNWDAVGIGASTACAIHCVLLPVLFTTLPFFGIEVLENRVIETATVVTSLLVGSWALYNGCKKHHHIWPLFIFIVGIAGIVLGNTVAGKQRTESLLKLAGACCIVTAHGFNWRYCRRCAVCDKNMHFADTHVPAEN